MTPEQEAKLIQMKANLRADITTPARGVVGRAKVTGKTVIACARGRREPPAVFPYCHHCGKTFETELKRLVHHCDGALLKK